MPRFARLARLRRARDFEDVFEQGVRVHEGTLVAVFLRRQQNEARLGLAISRRAVPLATQRNRLKRHARDTFRKAMQDSSGVDVVILAKSRFATMRSSALRDALNRAWQRVRKQCQES